MIKYGNIVNVAEWKEFFKISVSNEPNQLFNTSVLDYNFTLHFRTFFDNRTYLSIFLDNIPVIISSNLKVGVNMAYLYTSDFCIFFDGNPKVDISYENLTDFDLLVGVK